MSGPANAVAYSPEKSPQNIQNQDEISFDSSAGIEDQGIDIVPEQQRKGKARDLFFLWAGTTTNIFTVSYGAMLVILFGLSFWQAIAAIVIGNLLAYPLLGLASFLPEPADTPHWCGSYEEPLNVKTGVLTHDDHHPCAEVTVAMVGCASAVGTHVTKRPQCWAVSLSAVGWRHQAR